MNIAPMKPNNDARMIFSTMMLSVLVAGITAMYILYDILGEKARVSTPHRTPIPPERSDGTRASYTLYSTQIPHKILLRTPGGSKLLTSPIT